MYISDRILSDTELNDLTREHLSIYTEVLNRYSKFLPKLMSLKLSFQLRDPANSHLTFHDGNVDKIYEALKNLSVAIQSVEAAIRKP